MKLKYINFKKSRDSGPLYEGLDSILVLLVIIVICLGLAFFGGGAMIILCLPAFACIYALVLEVKVMLSNSDEEGGNR